ncbi:MAG: H-type lectin domain-containing protein [Ignavibacteriales bacterium]|nr:H-type lectin domain-containing protein [Ignavibacteriales bacterium]
MDADKESNLRYNVEAISDFRDGFTIKVRTWSDSEIIFNQRIYWVAFTE